MLARFHKANVAIILNIFKREKSKWEDEICIDNGQKSFHDHSFGQMSNQILLLCVQCYLDKKPNLFQIIQKPFEIEFSIKNNF